MDRGIYIGTSGGLTQDRLMEVITNNLAGSNVVGYKKSIPLFNDYMSSAANRGSAGVERSFVEMNKVITDFSQGTLKRTSNQLDLALSGEGFFVVDTPSGKAYSRRGDLVVDTEGVLSTREGYPVEGDGGVITLTPGTIVIGKDGTVSVNGNETGKIKVVSFKKPFPLIRMSGGLFTLPAKSKISPVEAKDVSIMQGYLESSNVSPVKEMVAMINALRAYEEQIKLIKSFDGIAANAVKMSGR